tara:strand:- start:197 stop:460 length:264 start_codon:yes stop_codon:yes gene_type:complete
MSSRTRRPGRNAEKRQHPLNKIEMIRRTLNKLPPFLDGYSGIARALENGDPAHAYYLAKNLEYSAEIMKDRIIALFPLTRTRNRETR